MCNKRTHKERRKLHFHERLPVDAETKEVTDYTSLTLGPYLESIDIPFTSECISETCNGDLCDGEVGSLSFIVNGESNSEYENFAWDEGDIIEITFG